MTTPNQNYSDVEQARLASGDYVVDPVFGVQPKTVEIQTRDFEADQVEKSRLEQLTNTDTPAPVTTRTPKPQDPPPAA